MLSRAGKKGSKSLTSSSQSAFLCFAVNDTKSRPRKRAKFDHKRREEVKKVRKRGACLRCRLLKIICSGEDPCMACMKLALSTSRAVETKVLRWSECIRVLLTDFRFFDEDAKILLLLKAIPPDVSQQAIMQHEAILAATPITLEFGSHMKWNIDSFSHDVWRWLCDPEITSTSKVGAMCSPQFTALIEPLLGHDISASFRLIIYAISLAYTQKLPDQNQLSVVDLQKLGAFAGKRCLEFLDAFLNATSLARVFKQENAKDMLQALFLMAFGTILAVGYARPVTESPIFPVQEANTNTAGSSQKQTLHRALQSHLCCTLAHHIVYLGSRLNIEIPSHTERFILDNAENLSNKQGHFVWKTKNFVYRV